MNDTNKTAEPSPKNEATEATGLRALWRYWVRPLAILLLVISMFRSAVADWNDVPTGSMKPTILEGDRVFVNKLAYDLKIPFTTVKLAKWSDPVRGDIVVFYKPVDEIRYVKRIIGLPGDRIELRNNRLFVNDVEATYKPIDASTITEQGKQSDTQPEFAMEELNVVKHFVQFLPSEQAMKRTFKSITVPADHYFVMGDNRDNSLDSRWWGFLSRDRIVGRASAIALSVDPDHSYFPRWSRFFTKLK